MSPAQRWAMFGLSIHGMAPNVAGEEWKWHVCRNGALVLSFRDSGNAIKFGEELCERLAEDLRNHLDREVLDGHGTDTPKGLM